MLLNTQLNTGLGSSVEKLFLFYFSTDLYPCGVLQKITLLQLHLGNQLVTTDSRTFRTDRLDVECEYEEH